ncbi:hypothetical protein TNCV_3174641 [Trichonephila clavipes]|nr:hypothetical protein TNCV_3174641 [Trichonephila clavipes]
MRRFSPSKEGSSREARVESGKVRETRTKDSGGHSAAEGRPIRSRKKTTVRPLARIIKVAASKNQKDHRRSRGV